MNKHNIDFESNMDDIDHKIIEMLSANARESFATIGKSVDLSAPAVGKRVKQLEEKGFILGYSIQLNHDKLGIQVKAYIILKIHQSSTIRTAYNQINYFKEVQRCDRITGEDSLCILAFFRNNKELVNLLERISQYGVPSTSIILES
ncbi:Lrp/AsnC family transcriptional regulator [Winogradskyella forsetii]|uniref:Lrp/AsnC family transcriptional regulator n=2 Tax=Winogradskyella forsetii TaxID=2686077 RepID=UPI0015C9DF0E|nr:Lrp/AsnC family transcriptional regulator [Winogradskyella forsetii]